MFVFRPYGVRENAHEDLIGPIILLILDHFIFL